MSAVRHRLSEQRSLIGLGRDVEAEVTVCERGGDAAARGPLEETRLDEERLVGVLHRLLLLGHGDGEGGEPDGATAELVDDRFEDRAVDPIETHVVDLEDTKRVESNGFVDLDRVAAHRGEVTNPSQQSIRDSRGPAAPCCDGVGPAG